MFLIRGIVFSYEAVRNWEAKLTPALAEGLRRRRRGKVGRNWYVDETYIKVHRGCRFLCRAIDRSGMLVDVMFSEHRDMAAAKAFFGSAKMVTGVTPARVTTDGHDSYPRAIRTTLGKGVRHRTSRYLNNRPEQDHRGVKGRYGPMRGSSAHDRLAGIAGPTMSCVTSSVPAPAPISRLPPTIADSTSFATPQRF
jgi:putative transposase